MPLRILRYFLLAITLVAGPSLSFAQDQPRANPDVASEYVPDDGCIWDRQFADSNDADRINKAIRAAIGIQKRTGHLCKVMVSGRYLLDKPLELFDLSDGDYRFVSVCLEAPAQGYVSGQRTTFEFLDRDAPGIVMQKVRQLTLRNIAILGQANDRELPSYDQLLRRDWWNPNGAIDDGPHKRHVGILVDPFYHAMPMDQRFDCFRDYYTATRGAGSTQILIDQCDVQGWVVGIATAGSEVQLGDSITIRNCNLSYNGYPVQIGESQNRGVHVVDCHAKGFDTLMTAGPGYGSGTGTLGYIRGGVFVHGHSLVCGDTSRGNGAASDVFAESLWAIGHISGHHGYTLRDCQLKLIAGASWHLPEVDSHLTGGGSVNFFGGYIGKYLGQPRRLRFHSAATISGTAFDDVPFFEDPSLQDIQHMRLRYTGDGPCKTIYACGGSWYSTGGFGHPKRVAPGAQIVVGGERWVAASDWEYIYSGHGAFVVGDDGTATATGLDLETLAVGDEIGVYDRWAGRDNNGTLRVRGRVGVGVITAIEGGVVRLSGVPESFPSGFYSVYSYRLPLAHPPIEGDLERGSNRITGISRTASWRVGDVIKGDGIPPYTRVVAVEPHSLTISKPATRTRKAVDLHDARLQQFVSTLPRPQVQRGESPSLELIDE